ncbi:MAG: trehalose-6-phosphate synthase [Gammaproteobacteria bacterium]
MRIALRFIIPLMIVLTAVAYGVLPAVDQVTQRWFMRDLEIRSELIARSMQDTVLALADTHDRAGLTSLFGSIITDERLYAVGYCDRASGTEIATSNYPAVLACASLDDRPDYEDRSIDGPEGPLHVRVLDLRDRTLNSRGRLVLVHDMAFVERRRADARRYVLYFLGALGGLIVLVTGIIAQLSWHGWLRGVRSLIQADHLAPAQRPDAAPPVLPELKPLAADLRAMLDELHGDYRPRDDAQITWNPDSLREILRETLHGEEILVVSNREPYIHVRDGERIVVQRPASGLVTALEPIMRACSGTWIAHGGGSADRDTVDAHDRVLVPPEHPSYRIRRIWLTPEEEAGYYYGFANEGLWPLCHIAHVRPIFRSDDWRHYVEVNRRFADAVCQESRVPNPIVLVQDYHFALLPRMVRDRLPDATVITFWHIPWPNPEAFAICPWQAELMEGLLGSSILGFHTRFHTNNFLDSVDRVLEARADRELSTISFRGETTAIKRYPISIEWPPEALAQVPPVADCHTEIRARHGLPPDHKIGVGVDRMDYTKGILERLLAVERLLELQPEWVGRFSFIQIAAPTRANIEEYQSFEQRLRALADRINARFHAAPHPPIILRIAHHGPDEVYRYYRATDVCVVTSLHDGMNLVAKEFAAARDDEQGVLILSRFTGASRELPEALVVNPYDVDQCATAIHAALTMPANDQRHRMSLMRSVIKEFNVYRWAGKMLLDAAGMRQRGRIRAVSQVSGLEL